MKNIFNKRKLKFGGLATAFTVIFIALVVLLNWFATVLVEKNPLKIDVTDKALFSFSDETVEYLSELEQDIKISVLATEDEFVAYGDETCQLYYPYGVDLISHLPAANEAIKRYTQYSDHIEVEYVDILADPNFSKSYPNEKLAQGQIIVSSEDTGRYKILTAFDLFYINTNDYSVWLNAEKTLTSAIMVTALEDLVKVQYTTGHNEASSAGLVSMLEQNAYEASEINLMKEDIAEDTDLIVMMGPRVDFTEEELNKIDLFLQNDGNFNKHVVYFAAFDRAATPLLDSFTKEWGIRVSNSTVYETDPNKYYSRLPFMNIPSYADEVLTEKYAGLSIGLVTPYSVPLYTVFSSVDNRSTEVLLSFTNTAVGMPLDATEDWTVEDATEKGPFDAAVIGKRTTYSGLLEKTSSVTVFGSYTMADAGALSTSLYANAEYLLDVFNMVSQNEIKVNILIKDLGMEALNMNTSEQNAIGIVFAIVVPVCVLIAGIVIWIIRRNK